MSIWIAWLTHAMARTLVVWWGRWCIVPRMIAWRRWRIGICWLNRHAGSEPTAVRWRAMLGRKCGSPRAVMRRLTASEMTSSPD